MCQISVEHPVLLKNLIEFRIKACHNSFLRYFYVGNLSQIYLHKRRSTHIILIVRHALFAATTNKEDGRVVIHFISPNENESCLIYI